MTTPEPTVEEVLEKKIGPALRRIAEFERVLTKSHHENNKAHYGRIIENIREEIKPWLALQAVLAIPEQKNNYFVSGSPYVAYNEALVNVREAIEREMK